MKKENITVDVLGRKVKGFVCQGDGNFYHFTHIKKLKKILEDGFLRPFTSENFGSGSVSFSADKYSIYPVGETRIMFNGKILRDMLKPMVYFDPKAVERDIGERIDDAMEEYGREKGMGIDETSTFFGLTLHIYANECEWFTTKPVLFNHDTVLEICYMIPWRIVDETWGSQPISCNRTSPQYAAFENTYAFNMEDFLERVRDIKKIVNGFGFNFTVDSCYEFLRERTSYTEYIYRLDDANLKRIANGEKPIPMDKRIEEEEFICKC